MTHETSEPEVSPPPRPSDLADELARRLGVETAWVERLAEAGAIDRAADGTFDPGDVHRVRLLRAFEESGVPLDTLLAASAAGQISLRYYDELHQPPTALTGRTYGEFAASLGERRTLLAQLFAAFGIAEPDADVELSTDDETVLAECLDALDATHEPDLVLRAIRMFGEGIRRAADAALGIYAEAVSRTGEDVAGLPVEEAFDRVLRPWARFARGSIDLATWLTRRHMSRAIDEYSIVESERILQASGFLETRDESPPAVAFVDLTGFTRLTQERGDEAAAALALRLGDSPRRGRRTRRPGGEAARRRRADPLRRPAVRRVRDARSARGPARRRAADRACRDRQRARSSTGTATCSAEP